MTIASNDVRRKALEIIVEQAVFDINKDDKDEMERTLYYIAGVAEFAQTIADIMDKQHEFMDTEKNQCRP